VDVKVIIEGEIDVMYNCPECNKEMVWSGDEEIGNDVVSQYYCKECKVELNKITEIFR
jgi:predicted RNA-binding Zn-ribbon protein involved in translation (DUF1610 family)